MPNVIGWVVLVAGVVIGVGLVYMWARRVWKKAQGGGK